MSYEDAPATKLVAKACCICGRPLLDAESIRSGIGPVCAEKTGFGRETLPPGVRAEANRLIYELAALQKTASAIPRLVRLRDIGFVDIADRIEKRLETLVLIQIDHVKSVGLVVTVPKIEDKAMFDRLVADLRAIPGRRWTEVPGREGKFNVIPDVRGSIHALYKALSRAFAGVPSRSPKGLFLMPIEKDVDAAFAPRGRTAA